MTQSFRGFPPQTLQFLTELAANNDRDWFAGTPHHKHVRARLEKV